MRSVVTSVWAVSLGILAMGCSPPARPQPPAAELQPATKPTDRQAEFGRFPEREFVRVNVDKFEWRATEGNTLGVQTAILEGDPSKPGFYLTINRFPAGVMSRPHYHPEERNVTVIKGTWYTGDSREFTPEKTIPLKPGEYMRHPAGGPHYDGALEEETWVAISGYGPTTATVIDGGELFGKSR